MRRKERVEREIAEWASVSCSATIDAMEAELRFAQAQRDRATKPQQYFEAMSVRDGTASELSRLAARKYALVDEYRAILADEKQLIAK